MKRIVLMLSLFFLCTSALAALRPELVVNDTLKECYSVSPNSHYELPSDWKFILNAGDQYMEQGITNAYQEACKAMGYTYTQEHFSYTLSPTTLAMSFINLLGIPLILGIIAGILAYVTEPKLRKIKTKNSIWISICIGTAVFLITLIVIALSQPIFA